jgi:hypothetical protein
VSQSYSKVSPGKRDKRIARQGRWGGIVSRYEAYEAPKIGCGAVSGRSPGEAAGAGVQVHGLELGEEARAATARLIHVGDLL